MPDEANPHEKLRNVRDRLKGGVDDIEKFLHDHPEPPKPAPPVPEPEPAPSPAPVPVPEPAPVPTPVPPVTATGGLTQPPGFSTKTFSDYFLAPPLNPIWLPNVGDNFYGIWSEGLPDGCSASSPAGSYDAEYFSPSNPVCASGLTIAASRNTAHSGYTWESGCIRTSNNPIGASGKLTYWQVRAKIPGGVGCWAGIWSMIAAANPAGSESEWDLLESGYAPGSTPTNEIMQITAHWTDPITALSYNAGGDLSSDYHIFAGEYSPGNYMRAYLDGLQVNEVATKVTAAYDLRINLQMAQNSVGWHPVVDESTPSPSILLVSGVEIWQ